MNEIAAKRTKPEKTLIAAGILLSFGGVLCWAGVLGFTREVGYQFIWPFVLAALALGNIQFFQLADKREKWCFGLLGFLFTVLQAVGFRLQTAGQTGTVGLLLCAGTGVGCAAAVGWLFAILYRGLCRLHTNSERRTTVNRHPRTVFWFSFFVILLCWLPVYLAYYPGLFAYDIAVQIGQTIASDYSTHHPLLHTLFLGGLYQLGNAFGSPTIGFTIATIFQMLLLALSLASLMRYLSILNCSFALQTILLLFMALSPIHSMLSISATKDVFFAAAFLQWLIQVHRLMREPQLLKRPSFLTLYLLFAVLVCLLRSNALWMMILACAPLILFAGKNCRKRLIIVSIVVLLLSWGSAFGLKTITQAQSVTINEMLCVPVQQMARVYTLTGGTDSKDAQEIIQYLPTADRYMPERADEVKTFATIKPNQLWSFAKLWGRIGIEHPIEYLDAFLLNTCGYWWLNDVSHAQTYGMGLEGRQGYLLSDTKPGFGIAHTSLFPALEGLYERLFSANEYQKFPVLSILFAPALYIWMLLFGLVGSICRKSRNGQALGWILFAYLLTLLLGPCVLIRYVYPFIVSLPLLLFTPQRATSEAVEKTNQ